MTEDFEPDGGFVFGAWDFPAENAVRIPPPVGETCTLCGEKVIDGDVGRITPHFWWGGQFVGGEIHHRECSLRAVMGGIGCHVDHDRYCVQEKDPDAGLSKRTSALMVWNLWQMSGGRLALGAQLKDSLKLLRGEL